MLDRSSGTAGRGRVAGVARMRVRGEVLHGGLASAHGLLVVPDVLVARSLFEAGLDLSATDLLLRVTAARKRRRAAVGLVGRTLGHVDRRLVSNGRARRRTVGGRILRLVATKIGLLMEQVAHFAYFKFKF